jgi:hypothetical protein
VLVDLTDWLLGPITAMLEQVVSWLGGVALVAAHGLDPALYMGPVAWMGPAWLGVVKQIIASAFLMVVLLAARAMYGLYLDIKAGVKWW